MNSKKSKSLSHKLALCLSLVMVISLAMPPSLVVRAQETSSNVASRYTHSFASLIISVEEGVGTVYALAYVYMETSTPAAFTFGPITFGSPITVDDVPIGSQTVFTIIQAEGYQLSGILVNEAYPATGTYDIQLSPDYAEARVEMTITEPILHVKIIFEPIHAQAAVGFSPAAFGLLPVTLMSHSEDFPNFNYDLYDYSSYFGTPFRVGNTRSLNEALRRNERIIVLANDITFEPHQWVNHIDNFNGILDGNGHSIRGFQRSFAFARNQYETRAIGLINEVHSGVTIRNLHLDIGGSAPTSWDDLNRPAHGGIYLSVEGGTGVHAGGLIGNVTGGQVIIENVSVTGGRVVANNHARDSAKRGNAGGLIGRVEAGTVFIHNSSATNQLTGARARTNYIARNKRPSAGGLVGMIERGGSVTISNSFAGGGVIMAYAQATNNRSPSAGGLVGWNDGGTLNISNSYSNFLSGNIRTQGGTGHRGEIVGQPSQNARLSVFNRSNIPPNITLEEMNGWNFDAIWQRGGSNPPLHRPLRDRSAEFFIYFPNSEPVFQVGDVLSYELPNVNRYWK